MTRTATVVITGLSPYSQSRFHDTPKEEKESHDAHDARTWREKAHYNVETRDVVIPAMSLKFAIAEAAKRLSITIPGKKGQTYTKNMLSGILVPSDAPIGVKIEDVQMEKIYVNADGVRGSGKRVWKRFPIVPSGWKASIAVMVLDMTIPNDVVEQCLREAGNLIGIGRFRPQTGGFLGRFEVSSIKWNKAALKDAA